jgi:hypothetical protein
MKKILVISILIAGLVVPYSFAQMQGGMMGQGMMGSQGQQQTGEMPYRGGYYPCPNMMGMMGPGMMGQGMMGYGMGHMMGGMHGMMGSGMMGPGMMGPGMMGQGMMGYKGYEQYKEYLDDTADLRKKLHDKKFEYSETLRKLRSDRLTRLEKEIQELQNEISKKAPRSAY